MNDNDCNAGPFDITIYEPAAGDMSMFNPMLAEVRDMIDRYGAEKARSLLIMERENLTSRYAFAIPTDETLSVIARYSPLVEIGAGSGYWAMCLAEYCADVEAYDRYPPGDNEGGSIAEMNWHFKKIWHAVRLGDETSAASVSGRSLFLCWPPPENPMAFRALDSYLKAGGRTVIVVGELKPVAMGDVALYDLLGRLPVIVRRRIHGWPGHNEVLLICSGL